METLILCPICGEQNPSDLLYCAYCRTSLERGVRVSPEEAERHEQRRTVALITRRNMRWSVMFIVLAIVGVAAYMTITQPSVPPAPESTVSAAPSPGNWPMFQAGPTHSGFALGSTPVPQGIVKWRFETEKPFHSSPAVVDGIVYAATGDWRVVALDIETGDLLWEHPTTGPVDSSPAVAGELVYIGLRDGRLLAVERSDGTLRWEFDTDEPVYGSPTVLDGTVYVGSGSRKLFALDAVTSEIRWIYRARGRFTAGTAIYGDVVALNSQDQRIHVLDLANGRHRLDLRTFDTWGAPVIDQDSVYVADSRGVLRAIDWSQRELPFEKTARWVRTQLFFWGFVNTLPAPKGFQWAFLRRGDGFVDTPALAFDMVYIGSRGGTLYAVDRRFGNEKWSYNTDASVSASPSIAGQTVYVGDEDGIVHGVDALTGEGVWKFEADGRIMSTPVVASGLVFVTTKEGSLYAIE